MGVLFTGIYMLIGGIFILGVFFMLPYSTQAKIKNYIDNL